MMTTPETARPRFTGRARRIPKKNTLLLPYQAKWARDRSRIKIAEKSRQIGWTWSSAYDVVSQGSLTTASLDTWISSRDEIQARLFLEDCKAFAGLLNLAAEDLGEKVIDDKGHSAYVLQFANRLRAHSMSSNPDAQAGKRGTRVLDEFALHPDPRKLYSIAYPGITWGGQLAIFSTHRGSYNFFNELIREVREKGNPKKISLHRVTLEDALADGFLYKLQCKLPADDERQAMDEAAYFDYVRAGCADEESFQQEYMCVPADDESAFLPYDLIAACEYRPGDAWEATLEELAACQNPLYVGVDIGRTHDLTVIYVVEKAAGQYLTRSLITLKNMPKPEQEKVLWPILALPSVKRACMDYTGLGIGWGDDAQAQFGKYRIELVTFSPRVKEELAYPVRAAMEDRTLRIPYDKHLRADLRAIRKETTAAGNMRFVAERNKDGHADRFWALALALHAGVRTASIDPGQFRRSPLTKTFSRLAARRRRAVA